jgi:hypothetical protein
MKGILGQTCARRDKADRGLVLRGLFPSRRRPVSAGERALGRTVKSEQSHQSVAEFAWHRWCGAFEATSSQLFATMLDGSVIFLVKCRCSSPASSEGPLGCVGRQLPEWTILVAPVRSLADRGSQDCCAWWRPSRSSGASNHELGQGAGGYVYYVLYLRAGHIFSRTFPGPERPRP